MKKTTKNSKTILSAGERFAEKLAPIFRLYGVNPLLGRLYAVLLLSPAPMSLEEMCQAAGVAKSTGSVALRKLLHWRVIRIIQKRADRRDFYEALSDPWEIFSDWTQRFFQPEFKAWNDATSGALEEIKESDLKREERAALLARMEAMRAFTDTLATLLLGLQRDSAEAAPAKTIKIERGGKK